MKKSIRNIIFAAIISTALSTPMFANTGGGIPRPGDTVSSIVVTILTVLGL